MSKSASHISEMDILGIAAALTADRRPFALAIVIDAKGSTSARAGAKAIFDTEGAVLAGWAGGGCAESTVAHAAVECFETGTPQIVDVDLDDEVLGAGMPCGGHMRVYVEPVIPHPTLWILGHGRVAECLCHLGALMSFNVVVADAMALAERYPDASRVIADDGDYRALTPASTDFIVIATQHHGDHDLLRRLLATNVGYIALIASRKRTGLVIDHLREAGFQQADIERIHAPAGIELHARTPEEIALSVISEAVLVRRTRTTACRPDTIPGQAPVSSEDKIQNASALSMAGQRTLRAVGE